MNKENLQLRRLGEDDKVVAFDCGDEDLNDFILTDAPLYYHVRLATSYVLEDGITGEAVGYFSLAHDRISLTDFPSNSAYNRFRKQFFAQGKMFKSYPALKICRLATDKSARGLGIGSMMLNTVIVPTYGDRKHEISMGLWRDVRSVSFLIEPVLMAEDRWSPLYDDVMQTGAASRLFS